MSAEFIIGLAGRAMYIILMVSAPMLGLGLLVGLLVSIFQAMTQIHEQTLAFIPKIIAVFVALLIFGPWILNMLVDFTSNLLGNLANYIG
ncbi:flagellar biosynthesis protein FliQ [Cohnella thailandensis]|uniref:Flagellar biosynthetic protein FliQ n=1 Tax=Cohnella thailandensis TaxID=557557 RepID=A0A841T290_9BACL|nr:flagellar biosynthesis protein FliQ [Cohnella thailandensis]MBB6636715.1 flagellar biosynthesis protein FliQ [Cohnella thailandensis]MBP1973409.1 flagellar biosynthetic protein FliQ [Cohnella thailandensis]